jgi:hypothetical protein
MVNRVVTPLCANKQSVDPVCRDVCSRGDAIIGERVYVERVVSSVGSVNEIVTVSFGNGDVAARLDSGADLTIVHPSCIPASVLYDARQSGDVGAIRDVKLMGAFVGSGITAELIHLPCSIVSNGSEGKPVVITCAVTDKLREKMLLKPSDSKRLEEINEVVTSLDDVGYTFENSWYDMLPLTDSVERVHVEENEDVCSVLSESESVGLEREIHANENRSESEEVFHDENSAETIVKKHVSSDTAMCMLDPKIAELVELQREDVSLKHCFEDAVKEESCFVIDEKTGVLFRRWERLKFKYMQLVVPTVYRERVMKLGHEETGHVAQRRTNLIVQLNFWWPRCRRDIAKYVASCDFCQKKRRVTVFDRTPIVAVPRPAHSFEVMKCDILGPFPEKSSKGHEYILGVIDVSTRWLELVPIKRVTSQEVLDGLRSVFDRYGRPLVLYGDNAKYFVSKLCEEVYDSLGVEIRTSTPLTPFQNGLIERAWGFVKDQMRAIAQSDKPREWDKKISAIRWSYNNLPHGTLGVSPYHLTFGHPGTTKLVKLKAEFLSGLENDVDPKLNKSDTKYLNNLRADLKRVRDVADDVAQRAQRSYVGHYNKYARKKVFAVGDQVLVLRPSSTISLKSHWIGPCTVEELSVANAYWIRFPDGGRKSVHASQLRHYVARADQVGIIFDNEFQFGDLRTVPSSDDFDPVTEDRFDKLNLSHLTSDQKSELLTLLKEFDDIFNDEPSHCNLIEHKINLIENAQPRRLRPYRIPDKLKAEVNRQLESLEAQGKIRKSNSPFAHPVVCVMKPSGDVRLCVDLRLVNSMTIDDRYPMPRVEDLLSRVSNAKWITKLDAVQSYHQIPLSPEDCYKTAFVTEEKMMEFVYMPFGAKTASQTYMRMMDKLLEPHKTYACAYIDDAPVYSNSWSDRMVHLRNVFISVRESGLTLKLTKCEFAQSEITFLGFRVGANGVVPLESKTAAIQKLAEPTTRKSLRSFLGMANYYKRHIAGFSDVCVPLSDLLKKGNPTRFVFNDVQRRAFEEIKSRLCHSVSLYSPNPDKPFILHCDASEYAVSGCLLQMDDDGQEYPIAFMSKKLSECQRRWSPIEREAFAIIQSLDYFEVIIFGHHVDVYTDHDPLKYIICGAPANSKLARWSIYLNRFDITVYHRRGHLNFIADFYSRAPIVED